MVLAILAAMALVFLTLLQSCSPPTPPPTGPMGGAPQGQHPDPGQNSGAGTGSDSNSGSNGDGCERGAPIWYIDFNNLNLVVQDTPIWVDSAYGPDIEITLTYNALGKESGSGTVGARWSHNYSEFIGVDEDTGSFVLHGGDGRVDEYEKIGVNYILNKQSLLSGEATWLPRLTVQGADIKAQYANGAYKLFRKEDGERYRLIETADRTGNRLTFSYQNGLLHQITNAQLQTVDLNYDASNYLTSVAGPTGYQASFEYNDKGELTALTDMQGYTARIDYDDKGLIKTLTDAKGTTEFLVELGDPDSSKIDVYPAVGDPMGMSSRITVTNPLGYREEYFYNSQSGNAWYISPEDYVNYVDHQTNNGQSDVPKTIYEYKRYEKGYSRISRITHPDNTWESYEYDENRNLSQVTSSDGNVIKFKNNSLGKVVQSTDNLGNETIHVYDQHQNLIKLANEQGEAKFKYDKLNRLVEKTDFTGTTSAYSYNEKGQLAAFTNAQGNVLTYHYTDGLLSSLTIADKLLLTYQYDDLGRVTDITDLYGKSTHYEYDRINQVTRVEHEGDRNVDIVYGTCPRMVESKTLPGGRTLHYEYNSAKQLVSVIDPMQRQTRLIRDAIGRVAALVDTNQARTEFEYDTGGRLATKRYDDGSELNYEYEQGYLKKATNARGIEKRYHYNPNNQLIRVEYGDDTPAVSYSYDKFGRVESITDALGTTRYNYRNDGVPLSIDGPLKNDTISFTYNALNQLSSLAVSDQVQASYEYDAIGRLQTVAAFGEVFRFSYNDTPGAVSSQLTYPNGLEQNRHYDSAGDLDTLVYKQNNQIISQYEYGFNQAGNITRLATNEGILLEQTRPLASYNSLNQIASWNNRSDIFRYDRDGNLIEGVLPGDIPFSADYDAESRLTKIQFSKDGKQIEERFRYSYDHFLRRYERYEDDTQVIAKDFVRFGLLELQERDEEGNVVAQNAWRPDLAGGVGGLLVRRQGESHYYYLTNHLGHVQGVFNQQGQRIGQYDYSPYGFVSGANFESQPFGMSTKRSDFASGLVYFGYRFYMPNLGRWLNRDPLQEQGGINLYAYVNGDPLGYVDPDGRYGVGICLAWPVGTAVCVTAAVGVIGIYEGVTNAMESGADSMDNLGETGKEQQKAIDCIFDNSCSNKQADKHVDNYIKYRNKGLKDAHDCAQGLATSVPGTSITGPLPLGVEDYAVGAVVAELANQ
ncbi:putative rhs-related protein [Photobacterium marinum]|uniref:Putative rhs-related protein n=1 Tax=Photobacterium marinum TaxID=1056511 RepID=L8J8A8_9GAMM|nr:RHS repeat-associated core domain-containing protein [Photobacterium marinum]ELR64423.1 putative rhs-related protein [Photobacterium marinum]